MKNLIEELQWRGMIQDVMPGTEEQLNKEMTVGYIGFDPTADSLHIGNLVPIILLVHLQQCGHKPIALVGGATGMIGDPSFKAEERKLLSEDILNHNLSSIRKQLEKFLDFSTSSANGAEIVNNYDWFKNFTFLDFAREIGKHISVNYMMSKDSVQKRLETGLSFTEFTYQLIQGYDFYYLNEHKNVKLQMGGSDQWGNITTGTEMIRRKGGSDAFAFTCPLTTKADGTKFGKSEGGNIWLSAERTSPYQFYQFWLNVADEDAARFIKIYTFLTQEEINQVAAEHEQNPGGRALQHRLAKEVTTFVHSEKEYEFAVEATKMLFGNNTADALKAMTEKELLNVMAGVPQITITRDELNNPVDIVSLLALKEVFPSKGEARKMVQAGGVSINKSKISGIDFAITPEHLLQDKYVLIQKGKKNYYLAIVSE